MKIGMTTVLTDINGEEITENGEAVQLRLIVQRALLGSLPGDEKLEADEKVKHFNLAVDSRQDEVDWSPENVAMVRSRVGKGFATAIVGPVFALLS
jgi:hypothetical protein